MKIAFLSSCLCNPNREATWCSFNDPVHKGSNFKVKLKIVPIINHLLPGKRSTKSDGFFIGKGQHL